MSKGKVDFTVDKEVKCEFRIRVNRFDAGYPAPPCSNPSSPRFSDPGADPEYEDAQVVALIKYTIWDGKKKEHIPREKEIELPVEFQNHILELLDSEIVDAGIAEMVKEDEEYMRTKAEESRREY